MENRQLILRIMIGLAAVALIVLAAIWMHRYFTTGKISVDAGAKNTYVRINKLGSGDSSDTTPVAEGEKKVSVRAAPGSYLITVFSPVSSTSKTVTVKAKQHLKLTMKLPVIGTPEPVYGSPLKDPVASTSRLLFIGNGGLLSQINDQGQVQVLNGSHRIKSAKWTNTSAGMAQDEDGNFYSVTDGSLIPITAPFRVTNSPSSSYALSPNGTVYLSNGQEVYRNSGGGFSQIYSSDNSYNVALAASNNAVAIIEKTSDDSDSSVVVIDSEGQVSRDSVPAKSIAWSPDGKHLAIGNDAGAVIVTSSLKQVASIPQIAANHFIWSKDDVLFYAAGNQLFAYNLTGRQGNRVANIPNNGAVEGLSLSDDLSYLYVVAKQGSVGDDAGSNQLFRLGLDGQTTPSYARSLSVIMPSEVGICSLDYINFTRPVITVSYPEEEAEPEMCAQAAQAELRQYDINPADFSFVLEPSL